MKEETDKQTQDHEKTPQWLKTIQLNSWEAELLISALVLYALFQIPDYLNDVALQNFERGSKFHDLFFWLERAIQLLSFGYILHILVRGIWVVSVGLSYVYPKRVDEKALKFKGHFNKELTKSGSLVKMVLMRLEELSSIIYGISFIFFGTLVGFATLIFSFLFVLEFLLPYMNENPYFAVPVVFLMLFYVLLCILVFIDFLTNGLFRRKNWSSDWFYYVAFFFRIVTLSFLYRRSLLVLISNTKGWKSYLIPFIVPGVTAGFVFLNGRINSHKVENYYKRSANAECNSANYENMRNQRDQLSVAIQSDIIQQNTLKLFLKDLGSFGGIYVLEGELKKTRWDDLSSDSISLFFNKRLTVKIDSIRVPNPTWFRTQHPKNYQFGFTSFIDLAQLEREPHFLKIGIDNVGMRPQQKNIVEKKNFSLQTIGDIFFIYDKP